MIRCLLLALALSCGALLWAQADLTKVNDLLAQGQQAIRAGKLADAEQAFLRARDLAPGYPGVYANLGYLYEARNDRARALDAYGHLLTLRPDQEYGRAAFKRLFFEGPFPRVLRAPYVALSPVAFTADEVRLAGPTGETRRRLAYTTSLLFHEEMGRGAAPVQISVPVTAHRTTTPVNRSCYGFTMAPDSDRYIQAFALSYPSATLTRGGQDYLPLGTHLLHLMLRCCWYSRFYLGRDLPLNALPLKAYMTELGPAGAENYQNSLFFYDVATARSPLEWTREVAHELGHLLLPPVGRFTRPEPLGNGLLGERLLLQYLALEAELVAGEPWPAPAAQRALAGLWPGDDLKVADYLVSHCRTSLDYWNAAGPDSPLATDAAENGLQHHIGFMLWVQAAHGPEMLRLVLQSAPGTTPRDFVLALRQQVRQQAANGLLELWAGSLNLPASKLTHPPTEGALRRTNVTLTGGDTAAFHVWLPEGAWALQATPACEGLNATVDGRGPLPLEPQQGVALGHLKEGWHTVVLQADTTSPARPLERLLLKLAPGA